MQLTDCLLENLDFVSYSDTNIYNFIHTLFITGLRPIEILQPSRWLSIDNETFTVKLAKGNKSRVISKSLLLNGISKYYKNTDEIGNILSVRYLERQYNKYIIHKFKLNKKNLSLYIFRHHFIKQLSINGLSPEQIQNIMCHADIRNTYNYLNSNIIQY